MSEPKRAWTQSQHADHNATHYPGTYELCYLCAFRTGRAGRGEDSIYRELAKDWGSLKAGDEIGPLCEECLVAMQDVGAIEVAG